MIDPEYQPDVLAVGLPASPGAATGAIVFDADEAKTRGDNGERVILVRIETSPEDFHGMVAAQAVLTARGGMTSHAAVVARGMGKPCVAGCTALEISYQTGTIEISGAHPAQRRFHHRRRRDRPGHGRTGADGRTQRRRQPGDAVSLGRRACARLGVRANADTPQDARRSRASSARKASACVAPSTCSSRATASRPCAR